MKSLAERIADGEVVLLSAQTVSKRCGVSRSTLERWVRNTKKKEKNIDDICFPEADIYIGGGPRWARETFIHWLITTGNRKSAH